MKTKFIILILLFAGCIKNHENQNGFSSKWYENENKQHTEAMHLRPSDISFIEIYENDFYQETKKTITNQDTIELVLYHLARSNNESADTRASALYYTLTLNVPDKTEITSPRTFTYQFWVCSTGRVFFTIKQGNSNSLAEPRKRNDFFKDFFYGIYKKNLPASSNNWDNDH